MAHEFSDLPYAYDSLEPYIDKETMQIHHDKHHKAYFDKFLIAIKDYPELQDKPVKDILADLDNISEQIKQAVINNGGGYYNHDFFWSILKKEIPFKADSEIGQAIVEKFGGFEGFKEEFTKAATTQFGSGWAWLVMDKHSKQIEIIKTSNQDCPLSIDKTPLLGIDVWEHSYYLKYKNDRKSYVDAFWNVVNWNEIEELYKKAKE